MLFIELNYEHMRRHPATHVAEKMAVYRRNIGWGERHLQCIWYDDRLRPDNLTTQDGENVIVIDPGLWNLEAGPDFLDATVLVGSERRRLSGDVEIHIRPADWDAHRHNGDPRYDHVVLHATYHAGAAPASLPPNVLRVALAAPLSATPGFNFDDIDLAAYPHAILPSTPRPCEQLLANHPHLKENLLDAAGKFRLQNKARRFKARIAFSDDLRQLFYEEVMHVLGYKKNSAVCRQLAMQFPLSVWDSTWTKMEVYARLLGVARLLPLPETTTDNSTGKFIRQLWDIWWKDRRPELDSSINWNMCSLRPQNHPIRRLAAAAALFSGSCNLLSEIKGISNVAPQNWAREVRAFLSGKLQWPFWQNRLSLTGNTDGKECELLGSARIAALISNVIAPILMAEEFLPEDIVNYLPAEDMSAPMRATAYRLFGRDHNPAFYNRNGLRQQGLLQINNDFCLLTRSNCAECRLASTLLDSITGSLN